MPSVARRSPRKEKKTLSWECGLCGGPKFEPVRDGVRHSPGVQVRRCQGCALVQLHPLPDEEALARFYEAGYRQEHEPGLTPKAAFKLELPEALVRVQRLKDMMGPSKSLLEIGASSGAFVSSARPWVRAATGVEPSQAHRRWAARELDVEMVPGLSDVAGRSFDVIVLFHVLEHVRRPAGLIKALLARLEPGGRIFVEAPNVQDALISLYQVPAYDPFYYQNAHLWYFSPDTLSQVAREAGASAQIAPLQRYDLSNHLRWMLTGKPGGLGFYRFVFPESVNLAYADALARAGYSDTLWAELRKTGDNL